jgi:hypothetical protein
LKLTAKEATPKYFTELINSQNTKIIFCKDSEIDDAKLIFNGTITFHIFW